MAIRRNHTELQLPFSGEWLVYWGGGKPELNHHYSNASQKYAIDFVVIDELGGFYQDGTRTNDASYSFGKNILSPAAGVVIEAVDGIRDNEPGILNTYSILGNYLLIKHSEDEFSILSHLRHGSLSVTAGEEIAAGQIIAQCGNSGHSTDAHLHYHLQSSDIFAKLDDNFKQTNVARGVKPYFTDILLERSGITKPRKSCSPIKGDIVSAA